MSSTFAGPLRSTHGVVPAHNQRVEALARRVLVKDHFESGWCSRTLLRLTDVVDNLALGFHVPHRYFTREAFARLVGEQRLAIAALDCGLELYGHLPVVRNMLQPKWQFIAVLYRA